MAVSKFELDTTISGTYPKHASSLRENGYVMLKGHASKILHTWSSEPGDNGPAKIHIYGSDIFTGKMYEDMTIATGDMVVPHVSHKEYILVDIENGDTVKIMKQITDSKGSIRFFPLSGDLAGQIRTQFFNGKNILITIVAAVDQEAIVSFKEVPNAGA